MPIPLIVAAGAAAVAGTAFGIGRFSKKGEIDELKSKIIELQEQISKLTAIITSQNETIKNLKAENKSLNALHFFEKRKLSGQTRGVLIFQYSFVEYLEFIKLEAEG